MKITKLLFVLFSFTCLSVNAQNTEPVSKKNIFEVLNKKDSASGATVKVHQDQKIENTVQQKTNSFGSSTKTAKGYRVQVFSSNVQRTAKNEAFKIEQELKNVFPEQNVYVNYISPFWKVRVGDFKTLKEAQDLRAEILKVFPELKNETYTVKDEINI